ncbi:NADH-ubiquinone oxidoreductase-like protein [Thermochaetoides thermophila DSM 1495]|uniref:NADH-ubiquinone oxidoreductase-like protein n=1 Tax=Chaetomium thermophilum (strain DSM 1495 / CBS 144.50 / IMI 039719) TaxID=759272 RepID=G0SEF0_CHATD|nr:NADH-ubiquinone oxidoreductase-like protein [Thermochaetoides thermophila DSM 1495]EGS18327.1 NADH-ubiquinone oxidoreductase-like protein [Thermochaetoides thermophila DSM 1495]
MASKAAAAAASNAVSITKKYTVQSTGIWERIRRALVIDPNRSNGVPLNPYNRNPSPGDNPPLEYTDPVTIPAGDIADNPYWKRDFRRNYPRPSVIAQAQQVALLSVGSAAQPRVELIGEEGTKALVAAEEEGKEKGVAKYLEEKGAEEAKRVLALTGGLPPTPSGQTMVTGQWDVHKYGLAEEQSYGGK